MPLAPEDPNATAASSAPRAQEHAATSWALVATRATALRCLVAGAAAWLITLAPILLGHHQLLIARGLTLVALLTCVLGTQAIHRNHRLARGLGISGFTACSVLAWWLGSRAGVGIRLDPVRGFFGVIAWAVYAASWSHPWSLPDERLAAAPPGNASGLKPRRPAPRGALAIGSLGVLGGLVCLALAWRVDGTTRAVWARAVGVLGATALVSAASSIASVMAREERVGAVERWPVDARVLRSLLALCLVAGAGVVASRMR